MVGVLEDVGRRLVDGEQGTRARRGVGLLSDVDLTRLEGPVGRGAAHRVTHSRMPCARDSWRPPTTVVMSTVDDGVGHVMRSPALALGVQPRPALRAVSSPGAPHRGRRVAGQRRGFALALMTCRRWYEATRRAGGLSLVRDAHTRAKHSLVARDDRYQAVSPFRWYRSRQWRRLFGGDTIRGCRGAGRTSVRPPRVGHSSSALGGQRWSGSGSGSGWVRVGVRVGSAFWALVPVRLLTVVAPAPSRLPNMPVIPALPRCRAHGVPLPAVHRGFRAPHGTATSFAGSVTTWAAAR